MEIYLLLALVDGFLVQVVQIIIHLLDLVWVHQQSMIQLFICREEESMHSLINPEDILSGFKVLLMDLVVLSGMLV